MQVQKECKCKCKLTKTAMLLQLCHWFELTLMHCRNDSSETRAAGKIITYLAISLVVGITKQFVRMHAYVGCRHLQKQAQKRLLGSNSAFSTAKGDDKHVGNEQFFTTIYLVKFASQPCLTNAPLRSVSATMSPINMLKNSPKFNKAYRCLPSKTFAFSLHLMRCSRPAEVLLVDTATQHKEWNSRKRMQAERNNRNAHGVGYLNISGQEPRNFINLLGELQIVPQTKNQDT